MNTTYKKKRSFKIPSFLLIFMAILAISIFGLQVSKIYAQTFSKLGSDLFVKTDAKIENTLQVLGGVVIGTGAPSVGLYVDGPGNFNGLVSVSTPGGTQKDALANVAYVDARIAELPSCPNCPPCPSCPWCSTCGDGYCDAYDPYNGYGGLETCSNCPEDCGLCPCSHDYDCEAGKICCGQGTCNSASGGPHCGFGWGFYDQIRTEEDCLNCNGWWTASTGGCCDLYSCNYDVPYGGYYGEWKCNGQSIDNYNDYY